MTGVPVVSRVVAVTVNAQEPAPILRRPTVDSSALEQARRLKNAILALVQVIYYRDPLRVTFTAEKKRQLFPHDQFFPLLVVCNSLYPH